MAIINIKGLEGLKGINSLSKEDRELWLYNNKDRIPDSKKLSPANYNKVIDRLYKNDLFRNRFNDEDLFLSMTPEERDEYYKTSIADEAIQIYKNEPNFNEIQSLTSQGKIDLINRGYKTKEDLDKLSKERLLSKDNKIVLAEDIRDESSMQMVDFVDNEDIFLETKAEDNLRKKEISSELSNNIYISLQNSLNNNEITSQELEDEFEKVVGNNSRYYKAFKDTDIFDNFTLSSKMRMMSDFLSVANKYDEDSALSVLDMEMQNYINENQSAGDWAWNTTKNVALKGVANIANKAMGIEALLKSGDKEKLSLFLQGKDENGNNLPWYNNPLYWQGVDQFNTYDSNEINKIRENGGISPYKNITRAGEEMEFFSWNTANEAVAQLGYIWSEMLTSRVLGIAANPLSKSTSTAGKVASKIVTGLDVAQSVTGMSEAEGLGAFQETLQSANEIIDKQIDKEVNDKLNQYTKSEQFVTDVNNQINYLKKIYKEQNKSYSDEYLKEQAINLVTNQLETKYREESENLHAEDKKQAELAATSAYKTTASIFALKEAATNSMFQKFLYNKGTRKTLGDNIPKPGITNNADNTIGSIPLNTFTKYVKPIIKNPSVEFVEEFSDSVINNFGQGLGLNQFNNYFNKKYNPEDYVESTDSVIGDLIAGYDKSKSTLFKKDAYYEGFIGALGGGANAYVKPQALFSKKQRGQSFRTDAYGNKLSIAESINKYIFNPILNDISEVLASERVFNNEVDAINKIIKDKGTDIQSIAFSLGSLLDSKKAVDSGNIMEAIDANQKLAFDTIQALYNLGNSEVGSQSKLYQETMATINQLADESISSDKLTELIDSFLGQPQNKNLSNNSNARRIAETQLITNAKKLLEVKNTIEEVNSILDNNPNNQILSPVIREELSYLKVMGNNWQNRLDEIQKELGSTTNNNFNINAEYGSLKSFNRKKEVAENTVSKLQKILDDVNTSLKSFNNKEDKESAAYKALELNKKAIKEKLEIAKVELDNINNQEIEFDEKGYNKQVLSKEEILSLNPTQRAWILDKKNLDDYSPKQQLVIKDVIKELTVKDSSLVQKVQDAAELSNRINSVNDAFSKIIENPIETSLYAQAKEEDRINRVKDIYRKKALEKITEGLNNPNKEEATAFAKQLSLKAIDAYLKENPNKTEELKGIREIIQFREDAASTINKLSLDEKTKQSLRQSIINITDNSSDKKEAINAIEDAIDSVSVDNNTKELLNTLLDNMTSLDYQRNATKVTSREERKKEEESKKKAKEKADKIKKDAELLAKEEKEAKEKEISSTGEGIVETIEVDELKVGTEEELISTEDVDLIERVETPSLKEQTKTSDKAEIINVPTVEYTPPVNPTALVGNTMYMYDGNSLRESGVIVRRKGASENDSMNRFFAWLKAAGIELQEIIDNELNSILKKNPKIQFLTVNPQDNATNDSHLNDYVLEVVEYTPEVQKVHNESLGGVITSNNKKWLIIGTLGFSKGNSEQGNNFRNLKYKLKVDRKTYFESNPNERFYVNPNFETKVEYIGAGNVVRKLENDTEVKIRTIQELLNDNIRNPRGLKLRDLKWGIQYLSDFVTINVSNRDIIHPPKDVISNTGNTFLLVEAANGEYIPIAIKPVMYNEINNGSLKDKIDSLLQDLLSQNHSDRYKAINELAKLIHLGDKNILIGTKNKNTISIVNGEITLKTFNLDSPTLDRTEFIEVIKQLNPRINITVEALSSEESLKRLDEAGALSTDIAKLGTSNADYSVYSIGADGKPITTMPVDNNVPSAPSELRKKYHSVLLYGNVYRERDGKFYDVVDKEITDPLLLEQLKYNQIIQSNNLVPVTFKGDEDYYLISSDINNPIAVKRNRKTNSITTATTEQAKALIDKLADDAKKARAKEALEKATLDESSLKDVSLEDDTTEENPKVVTEKIVEKQEQPVTDFDINSSGDKSLSELQTDKSLSTVLNILGDSNYGSKLFDIIDEKTESGQWKNVPDNVNELNAYLESKGIITTGITDVESWLDMIKNCK